MPLRFDIAGSAVVLPARAVPSTEVDALIGAPAGTVQARFGIGRRFWAGPDETSSAMAAQAARAALADAGWSVEAPEVVVGACGVMEQPIPGTAVLVQRRLGLGGSGIPAFDVNATCLSFLVALDRVLAGFALGQWRRALLVCADIASAALDFGDPEASAIFGDGAAAFALSADGPYACLASRLRTWGDGADLCRLEAGGTRLRPHEDLDDFLARSRFRMDGPGVFKATARRFPGFLRELLSAAGVRAESLSLVVPHQASAPALEHLKRAIPGGHDKTVDLFADHGNQIATSLAHALHAARRDGRLDAGGDVLLIGSSAGISLGGALIRRVVA